MDDPILHLICNTDMIKKKDKHIVIVLFFIAYSKSQFIIYDLGKFFNIIHTFKRSTNRAVFTILEIL